jgi:alpha-mannosidase
MNFQELTVLVPCHSLEDFPTDLGEEAAAGLLNAFAVLWHPQLLANAGVMPKWQRADEAPDSVPNRLVIVPKPSEDLIPASWLEKARESGSKVIVGVSDRQKLIDAVLVALEASDGHAPAPDVVADFMALGTVYLMTELLTRHMRNFSHLDEIHMAKEAVAGARSAVAHDGTATDRYLRRCFEMLLECRERFYPVDCFLIDLCLLNTKLADEPLRNLLQESAAVNLLAPAADWTRVISDHPEYADIIRERWKKGQFDLLGGERDESPTALIALDSIIWQLRRGREDYRRLFERAPTIWGRKRFGVHAQMPQILKRFGCDGALHFVMDDGVYPDEEQSKLKWEGADGTMLDAFSRIPLAGDSASAFLRLPQRIAESMDYDHTVAVCFARWPLLKTPWLNDLRRASRFAHVLGKFTTFDEFFRYSDAPGRNADCRSSGYFTPFLVHAVARQEPDPIGRYLRYWELRRDFEGTAWCQAISQLLKAPHLDSFRLEPLETATENANPDAPKELQEAAVRAVTQAQQETVNALAGQLAGNGVTGTGALILNTLSFARTVPVTWPAGTSAVSGGPVLHAQAKDDASYGVVQLPPCGFVWTSTQPAGPSSPARSNSKDPPLAEGMVLRNDFFEVHLSDATGGIGQILTYKRSPNRLSHQLAYRFAHERTITVKGENETQTSSYKSYYSEMVLGQSRVVCAGPTCGEIETSGGIVDQQNKKVLADFRQRVRVWRDRPIVELDIELDSKKLPEGDPWTNYYCCRFAWKDEALALTGSMQQGAHALKGPRLEAPHFIELADEKHRTTILTPGLPFHRKTGDRMLDSLLVVEGESTRKFRFAIAIDHSFPMEAALDAFSPPLVIPTSTAPTRKTGGWLFQVSVRNVQVTRLLPLETIDHDPPSRRQGYVVRLLETEGRRKKFDLKCFRPPLSARQCDFQGKTVSTLKVSGDTVQVDIAPYEICDVELLYNAPT